MCGRFTVDIDDIDYIELVLRAGLGDVKKEFRPNYNVAPTQNILTLRETLEDRVGNYLKWGFQPYWAKRPLINAQSESAFAKRTWAKAARERRCAIVADGFIEWNRKSGRKGKTPYHFKVKGHDIITFAGIWFESELDGVQEANAVILTTEPNELVSNFHDRMPVIFTEEEQIKEWLDPNPIDKNDEGKIAEMLSLMRPYPNEEMEVFEISSEVNSYKNNRKELLKHVSPF